MAEAAAAAAEAPPTFWYMPRFMYKSLASCPPEEEDDLWCCNLSPLGVAPCCIRSRATDLGKEAEVDRVGPPPRGREGVARPPVAPPPTDPPLKKLRLVDCIRWIGIGLGTCFVQNYNK